MFEPLDHTPAYLRLSEAIRTRIVERRLKDGEALPTETELARQFAVNRSTVREALRNLQSAGLVSRRGGGKKLYVSRPTVEAVGDGLREALTLHDASFADIWEALLAFEPDIARAAAARRSPGQLAELERLAEAFGAVRRPAAEAVGLVGQFFRAMGTASGNPVFVMANEPLVRLVEPSLAIIIDRLPQARRRIAAAQRAMVQSIAERDGEAAAAWMRRHVEDFRRGFEQAGLPLETTVGRSA
jgi:DNA-binding FadR family transcriptional regulator